MVGDNFTQELKAGSFLFVRNKADFMGNDLAFWWTVEPSGDRKVSSTYNVQVRPKFRLKVILVEFANQTHRMFRHCRCCYCRFKNAFQVYVLFGENRQIGSFLHKIKRLGLIRHAERWVDQLVILTCECHNWINPPFADLIAFTIRNFKMSN